MTASELKRLYEYNNPKGFFFCRKTMRFFGDRMDNFGVRAATIKGFTEGGIEDLEVWDLYRRRPVNGGLHGHLAYFTKDTGQQVWDHS